MDNEKTPSLQGTRISSKVSRVNDYAEMRKKEDAQMYRRIACLSLCIISVFVSMILWLVLYEEECQDERSAIDDKLTTVSEKLMDYTTGTRVDCTNQEPCTEWNCSFVRKHFHRIPDECEYNDWSDYVSYTVYIILFCAVIQCICGTKNVSR